MIYAILQARMNSSRLPGKVLMDLNGKSVLLRIVERLKLSKKIDKIVVATTNSDIDNAIIDECVDNGIYYFRGSENDVLGRYYHCAEYYGIMKNDGIVRITGDCPLIDPEIVDYTVELWKDNKKKYVSNVMPPDENGKRVSTYPDGMDCEVFSFAMLTEAWENAKTVYELEHVCPWMFTNMKCITLKYEKDLGGINLTLDTQKDYERIKKIYNKLGNKKFNLEDILNCLN